MDKKIAGLLGAVVTAAIAPATSYAALLEPIPNAIEALRQANIQEAAWVCCDAYGRSMWVTDAPPRGYYYHHHHAHYHNHHHNYGHHHHD